MEFGCTAGFSNFIDGPDGVISTGPRLGVVEAKDTDALSRNFIAGLSGKPTIPYTCFMYKDYL